MIDNLLPSNSLYDIRKTFEENISSDVLWSGEYPEIPPTPIVSLFGQSLNSRFGVAACPLTHGSKRVNVMSSLGYDLITYRSVRSIEWKGQSFPHWRYVDIPNQLTVEDLLQPVVGSDEPFSHQAISTANSFGIQSSSPGKWQEDFELAQKMLSSGQVLILSLMFTPEKGSDVIKDSEIIAGYGKETSAKVFEINLAHPNSGMKSLVYEDIETSVAICKNIKKKIKDRPLIAKIGYYKHTEQLKEFMDKTRGIIQGISSTNTYAMPIVDEKGAMCFPERPKAGVSGNAVRTLSMSQAKQIVAYRNLLGIHDLIVIGIGGVMNPEHINQYLSVGVDAVQSAVGVWVDPLLAYKYKQTLQ